jgi:hypothetical protein
MPSLLHLLAACTLIGAGAPTDDPPAPGQSHALIVVGLPGDAEHEEHFATVAKAWRDWLTGPLGFPADNVRILFGSAGKPGLAKGPAPREAVEREVAELKKVLRPDDRLWVFTLGHGDYDGERAAFHVPGPDLRADQLGKLFADVACREQVFWLTHSGSGWFLKALAKKGRIVVTATSADQEFNETEFPEALANVAKLSADKLDADKDGKVSILELYRRITQEVQALFEADDRIPTEHALLDDTGGGRGTEEPVVAATKDKKPTADGALAARTFVPMR